MTICKAPFFTAEVFGDGRVFLCCPDYTKIGEIGNIYKQSWNEIWNSEIANNFRKKILNGDYSSCYTNYCSANFFPLCQELKYVDPEKLDFKNPKLRIIKLSMDQSCNVACKICRGGIRCNKKEDTEFLNSKIDTILPILKDVEIVNFTGSGDPFASKHCRKFIKLIAQTYPNIRFNFHTNGTLCDKKNLEELGVIDRLSTVEISLHSATKETYDKIVKYGNWERLNKNLEFLSGLIKNQHLDELQLNFVVLSENYKDIPDFIKFAKSLGAKAFLWQYRNWVNVYDFDSVNVCSPLHFEHKNFVKIISELDTSDSDIIMTPLLNKFSKVKNVEEYCLYSSLAALENQERYEEKRGVFKDKFRQIEANKIEIASLKETINKIQNKETFFQKIFSVRNEYKNNTKRKVITIIGMKLKFRQTPQIPARVERERERVTAQSAYNKIDLFNNLALFINARLFCV